MEKSAPWRETFGIAAYPSLTGSCTVDVAIIGGGLTGIIAAYLLRDTGLSVAVLEAESIGARASGATTAFLMELIDTNAEELIQTRGKEEAAQILDSHRDAITFYEEMVHAESIACEFMRCPVYYLAHDESERRAIEEEASALRSLGRKVDSGTSELLLSNHGYFKLGNQAKVHPLKFLSGVSKAVRNSRIGIYGHTRVERIEPRGTRIALRTGAHTVEAAWVLMATHYPLNPQPVQLFFKKAAYLTYVLEAHIPAQLLPEGLYEDTANPYHYLRVDRMGEYDRLMVGGEDHRMDIPVPEEKSFEALKKYVHRILPNTPLDIRREWKGRIVEPGDGLAFLGPFGHDKLFYATGYSGNGLTYAAIAAHLFKDYVLGKTSPLQKIYAADRAFNYRAYAESAQHYVGEFIGGALKNIFV